jgi:hypothetical protein
MNYLHTAKTAKICALSFHLDQEKDGECPDQNQDCEPDCLPDKSGLTLQMVEPVKTAGVENLNF